ncbi:MAG: ribonuclease E/G [Gemmobacter sp.]
MAKKMLIDATHPEETRVVVVDGNKVEEFDFETAAKRQLAGNIYLAKITRVEPSLQAAFVDYGGNRHGFLAFSEIHPDYYQIPTADRKALLEEERAMARAQEDDGNGNGGSGGNGGSRRRTRSRGGRKPAAAEAVKSADAVTATGIGGMDVVDLDDETGTSAVFEGDPRDDAADPVAPLADPAGDAVQPEETPQETNAAPDTEVGESEADDDHGSDDDHDTDGDTDDSTDDGADGSDDGNDDGIESVAEEDVAEEIRAAPRPRPRRYKIQEVVKVRQIMLVQVVKEERGNKGAALTTYLSLAGRYCVLMPNTARGGGISRKITNAPDRKKLKEIAAEIEVPEGAGLIIRTAGAKRTKAEIKRDYEYLMRLWEQVRELTLKSIAPAPIYEEGDLIKRSIRDLYNREIDEVLVEGAEGYRAAKDFMKMIMPSHAKNVQPYAEQMPLFARYQVESYLAAMFNPVVQLKSGGYIVIGVTEALVAIDVNSGRATKEGSIEETALKTNLEACDEVARQLRLRDLAGLIVIDFIDMEERKNNASVEKRLKDKLKTDRARIQVGRISGFGLLEMSRQRLRPGMLESTTQPCSHCHGTGLIRSEDSQALSILRALEEEGTRKRSREVLLRAPVGIVNYLINVKREHIAQIEARYGMAVRLESDPAMVSPDFTIEKFKIATRVVAPQSPVVSIDTTAMPDLVEEDEVVTEEEVPAPAAEAAETETETGGDGEGGTRRKRRRRRRRRSGNGDTGGEAGRTAQAGDGYDDDDSEDDGDDGTGETDGDGGDEAAAEVAPEVEAVETTGAPVEVVAVAETVAAEAPEAEAAPEAAPAPRRTRTRRKPAAKTAEVGPAAEPEPAPEAAAEPAAAEAEAAPAKPVRRRAPAKKKPAADAAAVEAPLETPAEPATPAEPVVEAVEAPAPVAAKADAAPEPVAEAAPEPVAAETPAPTPAEPVTEAGAGSEAEAEADRPKRRGWWSLGR